MAGVERCVVTSSSAALPPASASRPATEADWAGAGHGSGSYHASKLAGERAALSAQVPAITVLPTAPVGPGDRRPTPTGKIIVDLLRGRMPATLGGGMNIVPVEDVAAAHLLALERGRYRRALHRRRRQPHAGGAVAADRASGEAGRSGRFGSPTRWRPLAARVDDVRVRIIGGKPAIPLEGVRMGRLEMYSSSAKAAEELGYEASSADDAIGRAVRWYRDNGYAA